jgi:hypothetical protein
MPAMFHTLTQTLVSLATETSGQSLGHSSKAKNLHKSGVMEKTLSSQPLIN